MPTVHLSFSFHQAHDECSVHIWGAVLVGSQTQNPIRPDAGAIIVRHFFRREAWAEWENEWKSFFLAGKFWRKLWRISFVVALRFGAWRRSGFRSTKLSGSTKLDMNHKASVKH